MSSPSRTTLSISRVEPTRAAAARTVTPSRSRARRSRARARSVQRAWRSTGIGPSDMCGTAGLERARQGERLLRAPAPRDRRCGTRAPGRPRREPSAARAGRGRRSGRGASAAGRQPAARPSGRSTRRCGRTMLNSFRQTWQHRGSGRGARRPRAPVSSTSTQVSEAFRIHLLGARREQKSTPAASRELRVAQPRPADSAPESSFAAELRRVDEQRDDDRVGFVARGTKQREMPFVECAHRRHEPDCALRAGSSHLWDRPQGLHLRCRLREHVVQRLELRLRGADRTPVRLDRLPVAALDRPGQLEAVVDRPAHQRDERFGRRAGGAEELGRDSVQRDEVVRRDRGARVVERPCVVGELERLEAERLREPEARLLEPRSVSAVTAAQAPSSCSGPRASVNVCKRMEREAARVRSSAASGVAPETCATQGPGSSSRPQPRRSPRPGRRGARGRRLPRASATPRSRRRAETAEPTRP